MLLEHPGKRPHTQEPASIAPTATVCGDVTIGAETRVLFGAVLVAEGGPVTIGGHCIIIGKAGVPGPAPPSGLLPPQVPGRPPPPLPGCPPGESVFACPRALVPHRPRLRPRF